MDSDRENDLSAARRALLERVLASAEAPAAASGPIPRRGSPAPAPLSSPQRRLWFMHQLAPASAFYNVPVVSRFRGSVDEEALQRALDELLRRHEVLRSRFPLEDSVPVQVVGRAHLPLRICDLRAHPAEAREAEAKRLADAEASTPFDLESGPVVRALLVRLDPSDHWFVLTLHHIVADGWSMGILSREIGRLYAACLAGRSPNLPELPIQYSDFAAWQLERLRSPELQAQEAYWRHHLRDLPALRIATDRPRPSAQDFSGGFHRFEVADAVAAGLRRLAAERGATLFMVLLAAFDVLLYRYTSQDDVVVGAPIAGRTRPEVEPLIGFFVNTLVLRTDLSGDPPFREAVDRVRRVALDAYAHQEVPFERLVEILQPERDIGRNPLFQVGFVLQNAWAAEAQADGESRPEVERGTAIFDLAMHLWERSSSLAGGIEYSAALFDPATVARLGEHFVTLLEAAVQEPGARISELPLLRGPERHRVVTTWNRTARPYEHRTLPELVASQSAASPNALAVSGPAGRLTYRELAEGAERASRRLRARGVAKGSLVLSCLERSPEMVVWLLGILKAGAVYVPLDPAHPAARLQFAVADTGSRLAVTSRAILAGPLGKAIPRSDLEWLLVDALPEEPEPLADAPDPTLGPDDLAYLIYTSGSTGKPKGVLVTHGGLGNLAGAQREVLRVGPDSRVLQFAPLSFDASIFEIFMALASGGSLHVPSPGLLPGSELATYLARERVTIVTLSPSALGALPGDKLPDLKTITVAGEACPGALVSRWAPGRRFLNLYGPTEATIWATWSECTAATDKPSIGRPIQNVRAYILDAHRRPVPIGVPGELWLGGVGLAQGYLNRPELTAERFHDLCLGDSPERLYKTGDVARFLPDGSIDYLGRADNQVKIRGHRIELEEVESSLRQHPAIEDAVVAVREDSLGERRLAAYVTLAGDLETAGLGTTHELSAEQVSHWNRVYEHLYSESAPPSDPEFHIAGWTSSYTGAPIPPEEMEEWLRATVERIRGLGASRVLEVGCGSGLLLFRLAPEVGKYTGTDFAPAAIRYLERHASARFLESGRLRLLVRQADDFSGIEAGEYDLVVLNSVVQYFPSAGYLRRVVESAVAAVSPRGAVFIGDVRSLALLEAFGLSVELAHLSEALDAAGLRERVARRLLHERELVIAPEFFQGLRAELPAVRRVEVLLKRGRRVNELSAYRYDVILHVGAAPAASADVLRLEWATDIHTTADLRRHVEGGARAVHVVGMPNRRLDRDLRAKERLGRLADGEAVSGLGALAGDWVDGLDPEDVAALAESCGRRVELHASDAGDPGRFDALIWRDQGDGRRRVTAEAASTAIAVDRSRFTNSPLRGAFLRSMVPRIRSFLETRLPEPFLPAHYVLLERLPSGPNGKVDRRSLPAPDRARPDIGVEYLAPVADVERTLARIWSEVLNVDQVGVRDNFFDLGGDSIQVIQIVARAKSAGLDLSPRQVFEHQTIEALARACAISQASEVQGRSGTDRATTGRKGPGGTGGETPAAAHPLSDTDLLKVLAQVAAKRRPASQ